MVVFSPEGAAASPLPAVGAAVGAQAAKIKGAAVAAAICKKVRRDSLDGSLCIVFLLTSGEKGEIERLAAMNRSYVQKSFTALCGEEMDRGSCTDAPPKTIVGSGKHKPGKQMQKRKSCEGRPHCEANQTVTTEIVTTGLVNDAIALWHANRPMRNGQPTAIYYAANSLRLSKRDFTSKQGSRFQAGHKLIGH
jgi:hypothetical protein